MVAADMVAAVGMTAADMVLMMAAALTTAETTTTTVRMATALLAARTMLRLQLPRRTAVGTTRITAVAGGATKT